MAILQLSRITHRKGLSENLPQLAGAELGWVLDERKLFVGNGTLVDGAPVIGNTEILTEFSDILALSSTYTYQGAAAGYVVATGEGGADIVRSLQSKFDDFVSVKDFGAVGDGVTDDTAAINRALFELFCEPGSNNSSANEAARRSLFFPAGIYKVSGIIKIPPHARLWGEGLTSSIIKYITVDALVDAVDIVSGTRYAIQTVGTTDFVSIGAASDTVDVIFTATGAGTGTGTVRVVTEQVVETADSDYNTGLNMGSGATGELPTGIEMSNMAIHSDEDNTLLKLDSTTDSGFHYVGLRGPNADAQALGYSTAAVEIATSVGVTQDITLSKLTTYGTTYGLRVAGQTKGVVFENSGLSYHYKGVSVYNPLIAATAISPGTNYKIVDVGTTDFVSEQSADYNREGVTFLATGAGTGTGQVISMDDPGPTGVVVSRNIFDNIAQEGIHFENTLFNSSGYNVFYNVANNLGVNAVAPVINMETDQCISIGDLFERVDEDTYPRVALAGNGGIAIDSTHSIHLGAYERQVGIAADLANNTAVAETLFVLSEAAVNSYRVDYIITRNVSGSNETRMGRLYVSNNGTTVTYNDEYTESVATGIVLSVIGSGVADSELQFTSTNDTDATMVYSVVRLD